MTDKFEDRLINGNQHDPLKDTEFASRELFERFGRIADGFGYDAVVNAAANLMLNAIRQASTTQVKAEQKFDELFARLKGVLIDRHYQNGKRRSVFPFDQVLHAEFFQSKNRLKQ